MDTAVTVLWMQNYEFYKTFNGLCKLKQLIDARMQ